MDVLKSLLVSFPTISEPLLEAHLDLHTGTKLNWQEKKGREQVLGAHGVLEIGTRLSRESWWVQEKVERDEERKHSPEHFYSQIQSLLA